MSAKCNCVRGLPPHGNQYAERDIEEQCDVYCLHVSHMTSEGLHSKSAIAAELARRDIRIQALEAQIARHEAAMPWIEAIAKQRLVSDMTDDEYLDTDFEDAFEACIENARAFLKAITPPEQTGGGV